MSNLSKRFQSLKALSQAEAGRAAAIKQAYQLLITVTSAKVLGAEWDPFWNAVIFITDDENVFMVTLNDDPGVGILVRCKTCRALFWVRVNATNLFYISRGHIPPNTHRCGQSVPVIPPHTRDTIRQVNVPELQA